MAKLQNEILKLNRKKMILAMEYICRQINDETVFMGWLMNGVADGDLKYGEWDPEMVDDCYVEMTNFADLMACFLRCMARAKKNGGLYCDKVLSTQED